jgi:hypothetical protein
MTLDNLYQLLDGPHYQFLNALTLAVKHGQSRYHPDVLELAKEWLETTQDMTEAEFSAWKGEE